MIRIPWKTIGKCGGVILLNGAIAIVDQYQRKKDISEIGNKVGKEIVKNLRKEGV